jgi:hypothetical protein
MVPNAGEVAVSERESPFGRWSRRKSEARKGEKAPEAGGDTAGRTEADFAHIDFDALDFNSDYARFTLPDTPPGVRHRALRKLWASSAVFTTPDGLLDYAQDYSDAAVCEGKPVQSAYRVGQGFMTDAEAEACATRVETATDGRTTARTQGPGQGEELPEWPPHIEPVAGAPSAAGGPDRAQNTSTDGHLSSDELNHPNTRSSARRLNIRRR